MIVQIAAVLFIVYIGLKVLMFLWGIVIALMEGTSVQKGINDYEKKMKDLGYRSGKHLRKPKDDVTV